jgi:hypothetical protein
VASGDYDGSGQRDFALLLAGAKRDETLLVAALRADSGWTLELLRTWDGRAGLYVETAGPGTYASPLGPQGETGELAKYVSKTDGIVSGGIEMSSVVYFRTSSGWVHVWTSD